MSRTTKKVEPLSAKVQAAVQQMYTTRPILTMGAIGLSILLVIFVIVSALTYRSSSSALEFDEVAEIVPVTKPQPPVQVDTITPVTTTEGSQIMTQPQSTDSSSQTTAEVYVNGKEVPLPNNANGTIHKKITSTNGSNKTSVDITVKSHSSSSDSSTFDLEIESNQSSVNNSE